MFFLTKSFEKLFENNLAMTQVKIHSAPKISDFWSTVFFSKLQIHTFLVSPVVQLHQLRLNRKNN